MRKWVAATFAIAFLIATAIWWRGWTTLKCPPDSVVSSFVRDRATGKPTKLICQHRVIIN